MNEDTLPPLNWLRVFEAAARNASFAAAGRELDMTSPAISQQVKSLENHLGQDLFRRGAHSVVLTQSGQNYLPFVQNALSTMENGTRSIFGMRRNQQLIVHANQAFAQLWLPQRIERFLDKTPKLNIQITASHHDRYDPGLAEIQIVYGPKHAAGPNRDLLFGESFCAFACADIAGTVKQPADILAHTLIEPIGHHVDWTRYLREIGTVGRPARRLRVDSLSMALALARDGLGIALLNSPLSDDAAKVAKLRRVINHEVRGPNEFSIASPPEPMVSQYGRAFRDWLLKEL